MRVKPLRSDPARFAQRRQVGAAWGSARATEALLEALDLTGRVENQLLSRKERVAVRADFRLELAGSRRADRELRAACEARDFDGVVLGMNLWLHQRLSRRLVKRQR